MPAISLILIFGSGAILFTPSGILPGAGPRRVVPREFAVTLSLVEPDPEYPLRFSASRAASIYTRQAAGVLVFLRKLEIQSESFLGYLYNPF